MAQLVEFLFRPSANKDVTRQRRGVYNYPVRGIIGCPDELEQVVRLNAAFPSLVRRKVVELVVAAHRTSLHSSQFVQAGELAGGLNACAKHRLWSTQQVAPFACRQRPLHAAHKLALPGKTNAKAIVLN